MHLSDVTINQLDHWRTLAQAKVASLSPSRRAQLIAICPEGLADAVVDGSVSRLSVVAVLALFKMMTKV